MPNTLYPYHSATGMRLVQTIDYVPSLVHHDIFKRGCEIHLENTNGSNMDWNGAEGQAVGNDIYLADDDSNVCLASEAIWSEVDADAIKIDKPGRNSTPEKANFLRTQNQELASAAREMILDHTQGVDPAESCERLKKLLIENGLWEEFISEES